MQIVCEGHPQIVSVSRGMRFIQVFPRVEPDPVLQGDTDVDGAGVSLYGSVIQEGDRFRMWHVVYPGARYAGGKFRIACAESDDGLTWRKPHYGIIGSGGTKNNHLVDLPFTYCPNVFIDPHAPSETRYRATGVNAPSFGMDNSDVHPNLRGDRRGYFTAHSADGLSWKLDSSLPTWEGIQEGGAFSDVITTAWDPYTDSAAVFLKLHVTVRNILRRSIFYSEWANGKASKPVSVLVPDEYDDLLAQSRGFSSGDHYGMAYMPTQGIRIGFLWNFMHEAPLMPSSPYVGDHGRRGRLSVSLAYQIERGGRWLHFPGRAELMGPDNMPEWAREQIWTASSPIDVGDETWLYFTGQSDEHAVADYVSPGAARFYKRDKRRMELKDPGRIGLARWTRNRILAFEAPLLETIRLVARGGKDEDKLVINATTRADGYIRVALEVQEDLEKIWREDAEETRPIEGYRLEDCDPISGDQMLKTVRWQGKTGLPRLDEGKKLIAKIEILKGTLYAFEFEQAGG